MRQIPKIYLTPKGKFSNYFNFLKKFKISDSDISR